ncbi:PspC domain-containing protein [Candidatus Dojkabacteria bacterium]|nr:PspC domain-containing protein [Candidatus Dojkabacteria bacterium]
MATSQKRPKMLYRSESNRIIAGICGGIGEYFELDPTIIRVLWIILSLAGGPGIFAYLILWLVVPTESQVKR